MEKIVFHIKMLFKSFGLYKKPHNNKVEKELLDMLVDVIVDATFLSLHLLTHH